MNFVTIKKIQLGCHGQNEKVYDRFANSTDYEFGLYYMLYILY